MKQKKYRVEAFIIPIGNHFHDLEEEDSQGITESSTEKKYDIKTEDEIDDTLWSGEERTIKANDALCSVGTESIQNLTNSLLLCNVVNSSRDTGVKSEGKSLDQTDPLEFAAPKAKRIPGGSKTTTHSSHFFNRISNLVAIDEKGEDSDEKVTDFCYHGCKNGCSAVVPSPQEVSEKIFRENWLKRLEVLKEKESILRSKEALLQSRERALFKREREVRIFERHFRDKLKQVEQYLARNKISDLDLSTTGVPEKSSENFAWESKTPQDLCNTNDVESALCNRNISKESTLAEQANKSTNNTVAQDEKSQNAKGGSSKSSSSCSSSSETGEAKKKKKSIGSRSSVAYKSRKPPKLNYEDLDTTLSADVGDSSFVQTSQKFNPELYKRPFAFTRSASERRAKSVDRNQAKLEAQARKDDTQYPGIEQGRILKKVTDNISASQDKNTKYQNYGLIDRNVNGSAQKIDESKEEKRFSYLNLETAGTLNSLGSRREIRDRPNSWNAETNEWLQKKRHAYNMTAKGLATRDFENKENIHGNKTSKHVNSQKKTDIKSRIFTIFR